MREAPVPFCLPSRMRAEGIFGLGARIGRLSTENAFSLPSKPPIRRSSGQRVDIIGNWLFSDGQNGRL